MFRLNLFKKDNTALIIFNNIFVFYIKLFLCFLLYEKWGNIGWQ